MKKYVHNLLAIVFRSQPTQQPARVDPQSSPRSAEDWRKLWQAKGFPWRTEPEIDVKRQEELSKRRTIVPDIEKGIYPFKGMKLSRADVEWLLATHDNGRGPVDWNDESQREREGLDLRGADLCGADLHNLPLACLRGWFSWAEEASTTQEQRKMAVVLMNGANLSGVQLERANLGGASLTGVDLGCGADLSEANLMNAHLQGANLMSAQLERANLTNAQLEEANLEYANLGYATLLGAQLERANLIHARLEGANLGWATLEKAFLRSARLQGANLGGAQLEKADLTDATLSDKNGVGPRLVDTRWNNTNLTVVDWSQVTKLGDEHQAQQKKDHNDVEKDQAVRLKEYKSAYRANVQLSLALRDQGLSEKADHFAYCAQVLHRKVFWKQRDFGKWLFSLLLALLAGYGYRLWRILAAYFLIVSLCAGAYFVIGMYHPPHLTLLQAFLESITAFHGRVFYELFTPDTPQIWVTAFEAICDFTHKVEVFVKHILASCFDQERFYRLLAGEGVQDILAASSHREA